MAHYFQGPGVQPGEYESDEEVAEDFGQLMDEQQALAAVDGGDNGASSPSAAVAAAASSVSDDDAASGAGAADAPGGNSPVHPKPKAKAKKTIKVKHVVVRKQPGADGPAVAVRTVTTTTTASKPAAVQQQQQQHADPAERGRSNSSAASERSNDDAAVPNRRVSELSSDGADAAPAPPIADPPRVTALKLPVASSETASAPTTDSFAGAAAAAAAASASNGGGGGGKKDLVDRFKDKSDEAINKLRRFWDDIKSSNSNTGKPADGAAVSNNNSLAGPPLSARSNTSTGSINTPKLSAGGAAASSSATAPPARGMTAAETMAMLKVKYRHGVLQRIRNAALRAGIPEQKPPAVQPIRLRRFHQFANAAKRAASASPAAGNPPQAEQQRLRANSASPASSAASVAPASGTSSAAPSAAASPSPLRAKVVQRKAPRRDEADLLLDAPMDHGPEHFGFEEDHVGLAAKKKQQQQESDVPPPPPPTVAPVSAIDKLEQAEAEAAATAVSAAVPPAASEPVVAAPQPPVEKPLRGTPAIVLASVQRADLRMRGFFAGTAEKLCARREQRHVQHLHAVTVSRTALSQAAELAAAMIMFYQEPQVVVAAATN
jgi:hypothetical protein